MIPQDAYSGVQPTKFSEHTSKVIQKVCGECIVGTIFPCAFEMSVCSCFPMLQVVQGTLFLCLIWSAD